MSAIRTATADGVMTVTLADVDNRNALGAAVLGSVYALHLDSVIRARIRTEAGALYYMRGDITMESKAFT